MKGVRFPVQDLENWELFCRIQKIDFQDFATEALRRFYDFLCGRPVNQSTTINDLEDQRSDDETVTTSSSSLLPDSGQPVDQTELKAKTMLEFYSVRTGNPIRSSDRDAYFKGNRTLGGVSELSESAIKMGIMQSCLLCKGPRVNSFSYCLGAIHEAVEAGVSSDMVQYLQKTFATRMRHKNPDHVYDPQFYDDLRKAAAQPNLPGSGGDLHELKERKQK